MKGRMTGSDIEAIVHGRHGDPFRVLGPHAFRSKRGLPQWEVCTFQPQAASVSVVVKGEAIPMGRRHPAGLYIATLPGEPVPYRLRTKDVDGAEHEFDDPYRFPLLLTDYEIYLHGEGTNYESYRSMGAHILTVEGVQGTRFAVWAPNAEMVSLVGDFNWWDPRCHPMRRRTGGIWELFMPGLGEGTTYKYFVRAPYYEQMKSDPYGFAAEVPPKTASIVYCLEQYTWGDAEWLDHRAKTAWLNAPLSIYEVHLESWMRGPGGEPLTYRELAIKLVDYVKKMGYTHIELMPIAEHPFSGSWGYQVVGYYAPTARFGPPHEFKHFVDACHQAGIGVICDWVPAHFPKDAHGLARFDGTACYEHADPRQGEHLDWGTLIFNFGRNEVRQFLISNALFWLKEYHIDGLRVDAVASMLYLDYSRKAGEWIPNKYGGNENLEAIDFLRRFNELAHEVPGATTFAEESTAFGGVSRPVYLNGLGFTFKWNMGWMHDMLNYFSKDPVYRKYHQNDLSFSMVYAFTENFVLPISHDEVVHGKGSLLKKMPGDEWQRFANARAFLTYMYAHPGKKLLFMGSEIGQYEEWNYQGSIRWDLLQWDYHRKLQLLVQELNHFYRANPALYEVDFTWPGFEWIDFGDAEHSVIGFMRRATNRSDYLLFCCNFTPAVLKGYEFGVPDEGYYKEVFNTDSEMFGGSNVGNFPGVASQKKMRHGRAQCIAVTLPPLAVVVFRYTGK
jgi:1,4-alpha-glucan branching enzyme